MITPEISKTIHADIGMSITQKVKKWKFKEGLSQKQILEALPIEFHLPNETLIGQRIRGKDSKLTSADFGGVVEIWEEDSLKVRGR